MANLKAHNIGIVCKNFSREHMLSDSSFQTIASNEEFRAFKTESELSREVRRWVTDEREFERASTQRWLISEPSKQLNQSRTFQVITFTAFPRIASSSPGGRGILTHGRTRISLPSGHKIPPLASAAALRSASFFNLSSRRFACSANCSGVSWKDGLGLVEDIGGREISIRKWVKILEGSLRIYTQDRRKDADTRRQQVQ